MAAEHLPDNQEDREVYLRDHGAESFIDALSDARRHSADTVITTVKAFADEPEVLYVALEYAYSCCTSVTMAPDASSDPYSLRG